MNEHIKSNANLEWLTLEDCRSFATCLAAAIHEPVCIALIGTLGAGKTQFVRFFVEAMQGDPSQVASPTFVLVNLYHARLPIAHLDLYRLDSTRELDSVGFDELVYGDSVCLVEWADKFASSMPEETLWLRIDIDEAGRHVKLSAAAGTTAERIMEDALKTRHQP